MKKENKSIDLKKSLDNFKKDAERQGYVDNFLFASTLKRLETQIDILTSLEKKIKEDGVVCTKEYVKGRENMYVSPAVTTYNKTCQQANNTTQALIKVIVSLGGALHEEDEDDEL